MVKDFIVDVLGFPLDMLKDFFNEEIFNYRRLGI